MIFSRLKDEWLKIRENMLEGFKYRDLSIDRLITNIINSEVFYNRKLDTITPTKEEYSYCILTTIKNEYIEKIQCYINNEILEKLQKERDTSNIALYYENLNDIKIVHAYSNKKNVVPGIDTKYRYFLYGGWASSILYCLIYTKVGHINPYLYFYSMWGLMFVSFISLKFKHRPYLELFKWLRGQNFNQTKRIGKKPLAVESKG